ncbi:MAG: hypothetical protein IM638_13850 [Bacteroidetes bacterium]|nr:hypothetical protein [Bacteroidota bacterium]
MKKTEFILITVALICVCILLSDHWTGIVVAPVGITLLAVFYFMSGFFLFCGLSFSAVFRNFSYTRHSAHDLLVAAAGGVVVALLLIGIQSKLMLWSFSSSFLPLCLIVASVLFFITLALYKLLTRALLTKVLLRIGFYGAIGLMLHVVSGQTLINHYYRNNSEVANIRNMMWNDPYNDLLVNKYEKLISSYEQDDPLSANSKSFYITP